MWNEWLARTLKRSRAVEVDAKRAPAPAVYKEPGIGEVRPLTARLAARAQDEETAGAAADV